ncbi:MAG TPA: hypothetical protein VG323_14490 [Thermoanaerobaculia bacterium]|nr:hypothetical protein [Thermoanaerobaculia bacterium]
MTRSIAGGERRRIEHGRETAGAMQAAGQAVDGPEIVIRENENP